MQAMSTGRRGVVFGLTIIVLAVLGAVIGYVGGRGATTTYTSSSVLLWDPSALRYSDASAYVPDSASLVIQVQAQSARILADDVIDSASKTLGISSDELRTQATVALGSNSSEMTVSATGSSAIRAQNIVKALVASYVQQTRSSMGALYAAKAAALQAPIADLTARVAALPADGALATSLSGQLSDDIAQQVALEAQAKSPTIPLSVTQGASLPTSPSTSSPTTLAVIGAGIGLLIGVGIVALMMLRGVPARARRRPSTAATTATGSIETA